LRLYQELDEAGAADLWAMEPMNATQTHSKVRVTASVSAPVFVAGDEVSGKMELDCRTDKGLGIDTMMVELVAVQGELFIRRLATTIDQSGRVDVEGSLRDVGIHDSQTVIPGSRTSSL
jgi:hypothetical protein